MLKKSEIQTMVIQRTLAHKEAERTIRLDNRPAWGCYLTENATGRRLGVRFTWLNGPWACSPDKHFTDDGGNTYKRVSSFLQPPDWIVDQQIAEIETDPEKLSSLRRLMASYRESLDEPISST